MTDKKPARVVRHRYNDNILQIEQNTAGWPGSGFQDKKTKIEVYSVKEGDHTDEVRISINIDVYFSSGKNRTERGHLTISRELANKLAETINNPVSPVRS